MFIKTHRTALAAIAFAATMGTALAAGDANVFRFGVPYPQTGALAEYGANYSDGIRLAVQEVNDKGGLTVGGRKVKVEAVYCDTQADTAKAAACGRRLSSQDAVPAMLISTSLETFPIMSFNTDARSPFLIVSSSASNKLVSLNNPLVVRYWYNTYSYMPSFTKMLKDALGSIDSGPQVVSVMQGEDEFGKAWADTFTKGWKAAGGTIGGVATYPSISTDVYPQLTALLKTKPTVLAVPGACPQITPVVKQARELGFTGRFVFQISCGPQEISKHVGEKMIEGSLFEGGGWDIPSERVNGFKAAFKKTFKRDAVVICADGYGQAMWLFGAVQKAGSLNDPQKIRAALGAVMDQDWNILNIKDLQPSGETVAIVHPRIVKSLADIVDYTGGK